MANTRNKETNKKKRQNTQENEDNKTRKKIIYDQKAAILKTPSTTKT